MPLPTKDEIQTGQYSSDGSPFIQVAAKSGINPDTLEYSADGSPWWSVGAAAVVGTIKKVGGSTWGAIKKIGGVLLANIKKLAGITSVLLVLCLLGQSCTRRRVVIDNGLPGIRVDAPKRSHVPNVPAVGLALLSGALYGAHETVVHHPHRIQAGWSQRFWNNDISWRNKYAGGNPDNGPRFPGSTTVFAWATDAKHLLGTGHRATLFMSGVTITLGEKKPVWHYAVDAALSSVAFGLGFHTIYSSNLVFRDR